MELGLKRILFIPIFILAIVTSYAQDSHALFQISVDSRFIDFGYMSLGEFKELHDKGSYQNEVTCQSDKGETWYLKIHLVSPLRWGANEIPAENFKWKAIDLITGTGYVTNRNLFNDFSNIPMLVYTSSPEDNAGREVKIRFTYGLQVPGELITGNYQATIRYTFTETL